MSLKEVKKILIGAKLIWQNKVILDLSTFTGKGSDNDSERFVYNPKTNVIDYTAWALYAGKYYPNIYYIDLQPLGAGFTKISFDFNVAKHNMQSAHFLFGLSATVNRTTYVTPELGVRWDGYYRRLLASRISGEDRVYNTDAMPNYTMHRVVISNTLMTITNIATGVIVYAKALNCNLSDYRYLRWQAKSENTATATPPTVSEVSGVISNIVLE